MKHWHQCFIHSASTPHTRVSINHAQPIHRHLGLIRWRLHLMHNSCLPSLLNNRKETMTNNIHKARSASSSSNDRRKARGSALQGTERRTGQTNKVLTQAFFSVFCLLRPLGTPAVFWSWSYICCLLTSLIDFWVWSAVLNCFSCWICWLNWFSLLLAVSMNWFSVAECCLVNRLLHADQLLDWFLLFHACGWVPLSLGSVCKPNY